MWEGGREGGSQGGAHLCWPQRRWGGVMGIAEKHLDCMSVGKELLCKIVKYREGIFGSPLGPAPIRCSGGCGT